MTKTQKLVEWAKLKQQGDRYMALQILVKGGEGETMTTQGDTSNKGSITELQEKYAKHCGYKTFEELRERDEEALRIYYLQMI